MHDPLLAIVSPLSPLFISGISPTSSLLPRSQLRRALWFSRRTQTGVTQYRGGEFVWARVVLAVPHEDVVGLEWCMGMPPLVHFLDFIFLLVNVSPPCPSLPCHASFAAASEFVWARVVLAVRHRPHEDVVGLEWCMGMPPLVHFLDFIFLLVYVSPPCASLPLSCFLRRSW